MLAIITTHPIQYQIPIWQALAADGRVPFEVWYLTDFGTRPSLDREFGKTFAWDIETLSGYPHRFLTSAEGANPVDFWRCRIHERLRNRIRASGVTAVWIQGWQVAGYWQAVREARLAGAKVWLRAESNDLAPTPWWKRALKSVALGHLFSQVDCFLFIGSANRRLYRQYGVPDTHLLPAPYAVDNERFARQAESLRGERTQLRLAWGIPENAFCVLFCGKFIDKKRPLDLVEAAGILRSSGRLPNVHLLFCGSGDLDRAVREACTVVCDVGSNDCAPCAVSADRRTPATFVGFLNQSEISRAYVAADCLVLASDHRETWGLVVNEAMASGIPCIASDSCGCAEDLVGREWSYPVGDVDALARKLVELSITRPAFRTLPAIRETVSAVVDAYRCR